MALEMWNGSVASADVLGTSPIREVVGATREAIRTASRRPWTRSVRPSGPEKRADCSARASSIVTKSSRPRSASATSSVQ